jgi:hypothetical protein
MKHVFLSLVLLACLSACSDDAGKASAQGRPSSSNPSKRMGFSDMPQRMPIMREQYYGPEGACTVGRQTKGWC